MRTVFLLATDMVIDGPQKILVRVFGRDTHLIINRDRETEVCVCALDACVNDV